MYRNRRKLNPAVCLFRVFARCEFQLLATYAMKTHSQADAIPTATAEGQALTLKVMRLSRVKLDPRVEPPFEPRLNSIAVQSTAVEHSDLRGPDVLTLPSSFGTIYLGERFACYLCINNETLSPVANVGLRAELQTNTQRILLLDPAKTSVDSFPVGSTFDRLVNYEIKELGVHVLVCTVQFTDQIGERKFFRKFFKFQVFNPLLVKTKITHPTFAGGQLLEVQVQNNTASPLSFVSVRFESNPSYVCHDLNRSTNDADDALWITSLAIHQFLYWIVPTQASHSPELGHLDFVWRTGMGETGHLQTSQITHKPRVHDIEIVRLKPEASADVVRVGDVFEVGWHVINNTSRTRQFELQFSSAQLGLDVRLCGPLREALAPLGPHSRLRVRAAFTALTTGILRIEGMKLVDVETNEILDPNEPTDVFVQA